MTDENIVQIELLTARGVIARVKMPAFTPPPELIVWKKRYFIRNAEGRYQEPEFIFWLPDSTGEGREERAGE